MVIFFPKIGKLDFTSKNAAVITLLMFCLVFFTSSLSLAAASAKYPQLTTLSGETWKLFGSTFAALFLALNITNRGGAPPEPPTPPKE